MQLIFGQLATELAKTSQYYQTHPKTDRRKVYPDSEESAQFLLSLLEKAFLQVVETGSLRSLLLLYFTLPETAFFQKSGNGA